MKKRILFTSVIAIGGAAFAYKKLHDSVNNVPQELKRNKRTYEYSKDYEAITISDDVADIFVKKAKDDKIKVVCFENFEYFYDISDTTHLTIVPNKELTHLEKVKNFMRTEKHYIEVYVPEDLNPNIIIKNRLGNIVVNDIELNNLFVTTKNGVVIATNLEVENTCAINNSNGVINAENITGESVTIQNGNGATVVYNVTGNKKVTVGATNGEVSGYGIKSNGDLEIENRNGVIEVQSLDFEGVANITNRNGKIDVTFEGDEESYKITTSTVDDTILPENETGKEVNLITRHGKIDYAFE